jgi:ferredoxin
MSSITFVSMRLPTAVTVRFKDHERPTLLSLAQGHGIPLQCDCLTLNCGNQGCGSCAVKVAAVRPAFNDTVSLGELEKAALLRAGRLTSEQYQAPVLMANTPVWRLACQYVPCNEDAWVAF